MTLRGIEGGDDSSDVNVHVSTQADLSGGQIGRLPGYFEDDGCRSDGSAGFRPEADETFRLSDEGTGDETVAGRPTGNVVRMPVARKVGGPTALMAAAAVSVAACGGGQPVNEHHLSQEHGPKVTRVMDPDASRSGKVSVPETPAKPKPAKPPETLAQVETDILVPTARQLAAEAIAESRGPHAVFTVKQLGRNVAQLTADTPAYTVDAAGNTPLNGDFWDVSLMTPTRQETQELKEMTTGLQGDITVVVTERRAGELTGDDARGVESVAIETENMGNNFPNDNPDLVDTGLIGPIAQRAWDLPDGPDGWDGTRQVGDGNVDTTKVATSDKDPAYNPTINGEGPEATTQTIADDARREFAALQPNLDSPDQRKQISGNSDWYDG